MSKYNVPDDYWEQETKDQPPAWQEDTSAKSIEIDVRLHREGYQEDRKWTVHVADWTTDEKVDAEVHAGWAVEHQNKGNYWREGDKWDDAVDFVDLPLRIRERVASVLGRGLSEITPDERTINREDGTGIADRHQE